MSAVAPVRHSLGEGGLAEEDAVKNAPFLALNGCLGSRGFTLVEVVLALGVVAFAMVSLMGLLGSGMVAVSRAVNNTIVANVTQEIINQAEFQTYATLTSATPLTTMYFDYEGKPLANSTGAQYYTASAPAVLQLPTTAGGNGYFTVAQSATSSEPAVATVVQVWVVNVNSMKVGTVPVLGTNPVTFSMICPN